MTINIPLKIVVYKMLRCTFRVGEKDVKCNKMCNGNKEEAKNVNKSFSSELNFFYFPQLLLVQANKIHL